MKHKRCLVYIGELFQVVARRGTHRRQYEFLFNNLELMEIKYISIPNKFVLVWNVTR